MIQTFSDLWYIIQRLTILWQLLRFNVVITFDGYIWCQALKSLSAHFFSPFVIVKGWNRKWKELISEKNKLSFLVLGWDDEHPEALLPSYPGEELQLPGQGRRNVQPSQPDEHHDGAQEVLQSPLPHQWWVLAINPFALKLVKPAPTPGLLNWQCVPPIGLLGDRPSSAWHVTH